MASYLGNLPSNNFVSLKRQVITGNGGSSYTLDYSVASVNDVAIFVNNVRQNPSSYSISGTSLTLGGNIDSNTECYVIFLGQALQTVVPDTNTITTAMIQNNAVTPAKMDLSQDYTFTGKVSGHNYPAFSVTMGSEQSLTQNTYTKVIFDTEVFDTDSAYDTSTGRFTCPTGKDGKYFFTSTISMNAVYAYVQVDFYKNGSSIYRGTAINTSTSATNINAVIDLSANDYIEVYCKQNQTNNVEGGNNHTHFHGYRIGD